MSENILLINLFRASYGLKNLSAQQLVDCDNGNYVRNIFLYTIAAKLLKYFFHRVAVVEIYARLSST